MRIGERFRVSFAGASYEVAIVAVTHLRQIGPRGGEQRVKAFRVARVEPDGALGPILDQVFTPAALSWAVQREVTGG